MIAADETTAVAARIDPDDAFRLRPMSQDCDFSEKVGPWIEKGAITSSRSSQAKARETLKGQLRMMMAVGDWTHNCCWQRQRIRRDAC
jgi:hypothetical protein